MARVTLRGYQLSALSYPNERRCVVTIRKPNYYIVAEYSVRVSDPHEAIRQVVRAAGRDVLEQIPGYLSVTDDLDAIEQQW